MSSRKRCYTDMEEAREYTRVSRILRDKQNVENGRLFRKYKAESVELDKQGISATERLTIFRCIDYIEKHGEKEHREEDIALMWKYHLEIPKLRGEWLLGERIGVGEHLGVFHILQIFGRRHGINRFGEDKVEAKLISRKKVMSSSIKSVFFFFTKLSLWAIVLGALFLIAIASSEYGIIILLIVIYFFMNLWTALKEKAEEKQKW